MDVAWDYDSANNHFILYVLDIVTSIIVVNN